MASFHDSFCWILFWILTRKVNKEAGIICFEEKISRKKTNAYDEIIPSKIDEGDDNNGMQ